MAQETFSVLTNSGSISWENLSRDGLFDTLQEATSLAAYIQPRTVVV